MAQAVAILPFGIGVMLIISIMAICNTFMKSVPKNTLSKCPKRTPIDARLNTTRAATNQRIGTDLAAVMKPFLTVTTLTISSTDACIIRMETIAMITVP